MSIRVIAAAALTATGMVIATCGTAAAAASRAAGPAVQLTGVQLLSALLPRSDFPSGYKLDKTSVFDSGSHLENSPARYHLSTMSCNSFASNFGNAGFGETATAYDDFTNGSSTRAYAQQVYQFKTARAAASFFNGLRAIARRCPSFLFSGFGSGVSTRVFDAAPVGGHRTFQVDQSGSQMRILTAIDLVFTVAGPDVFITGNLGVTVAPPGSPSARTSMLRLIHRVEAFR